MSLVSSSARVVYAALAGDLAVAAAKFGASALSGSSAMLTEAIHSLVDSADQLLLLTGQSRARKPLTEPTLSRSATPRCWDAPP
jgi:divalent metal cation (Fe/Co/Zn/Cd) transporter